MGFQHYGKHITKFFGRSGLNEKKLEMKEEE
jgi:hypothetical protein